MSKWKKVIENVSANNENVKCNPSATKEEIEEVESKLKIKLPKDLKELLLELNGDNYFVFSTSQIIDINLTIREAMTSYMPLDCLLFIAGNGCGDYFGYPITVDGLKDWEIFMWEHESDNRFYRSNGLEDVIRKYYNDEI